MSTPIWTAGTPGSGERFSVTPDVAITADQVANVVHKAVESPKYPGGSIIEVSKLGTRVIPEWHIDPPGMVDGKMAQGTDIAPEAIAKAMKPALDVTERERGAATR